MIIVEGIDNSGKSTLILQLQETFRIPAIRSGMRPTSQKDITHYHNWCAASPTPLILDRHPVISDQVYGLILRGYSPSNPSLAQLLRQDHFLVFCHPSFKVVSQSIHERDQMDGVEEQLHSLYIAYRDLMDQLEPDFIYDYTNPHSLPALVNQLTHYLARES